jgi:hypothetical protein
MCFSLISREKQVEWRRKVDRLKIVETSRESKIHLSRGKLRGDERFGSGLYPR